MVIFKQTGTGTDGVSGELTRNGRMRRLQIRSWRRGTREMDIVLGGFFNRFGPELDDELLTMFEAMLERDDPEINAWILGTEVAPAKFKSLLSVITAKKTFNL